LEQAEAKLASLLRKDDNGMANSFPLGAGRGGRARLSAKRLDQKIDSSVRRAGEIIKLRARIAYLKSPACPEPLYKRAKRVSVKAKPEGDRLFIGVYPCGLVYADTWIEKHGDYKKLAFLSYRELEIDWSKGRIPKELKARIVAHAATMQAKRRQSFPISTCGQFVTLGK
jgi:hypothetical protein